MSLLWSEYSLHASLIYRKGGESPAWSHSRLYKWIVCLKKRLQCPLDIGDWDGEVEIYQNDLYMLLLAFYCLLLFIYVFIYFCFFFKWLIWWGMRRAWQPTPIFLHREFPWTEVPGGIQSMGSQRVGNHWTSNHSTAHGEG